MVLPRYTGKPDEQFDRFLDQLTTLLKSSGVPAKHWTNYLKQQVQQDLRAYDSVVFAEQECKHTLGEDPTNITIEQYETYFSLVKASLVKKRGNLKMNVYVNYFMSTTTSNKVKQNLFQLLHIDFVTFNTNSRNVFLTYTIQARMMISN